MDKKSILPLEGGRYYHIFNKGNNKDNIFFNENNYTYFLKKYKQYLFNYVDTYSYCLLKNHFHLLLQTKDKIIHKEIIITDQDKIGTIISEQFRHFFISYAMSINKQEKRMGSLFIKNFKRKLVTDDDYLKYLLFYIHYNPEKHGFTNDFKKYKHSSYASILSTAKTNLRRDEVLNDIFNNKEEFIEFHDYYHDENKYEQFIVE
ncbi:MAG: hypothetical protein DRJ05_04995 [Bacteroidetes bacterium]|nr:MAG: hypothetical protein DRJ05_04995 [Bacteroidota bacterium]